MHWGFCCCCFKLSRRPGASVYLCAFAWALPVHPWVLSPRTVHCAAGEYHTCWTQFHLERNWRTRLTLSHSKFKSDLHSVRWNQGNPPSNFEMRPSRPRGLWVARRGLTALRDISRDLSPSIRVYLSVLDCSTSVSLYLSFTLSLSLNIEDSFISSNPLFFFFF